MTTISNDACKLWRVGLNLIGEVLMIPFEVEVRENAYDDEYHCCAANSGKLVIAMRGAFLLEVYTIDADNETFEKTDTINLKREILANGNPGFDFKWKKDIVHDLRFTDETDKVLRVTFTRENNYCSALI